PADQAAKQAAKMMAAQQKALEAEVKAALRSQQKTIVAEQKAALTQAKKNHEAQLKLALLAEKKVEEALKKAVTAEEKAGLKELRKEAKKARERADLAHQEMLAIEDQHQRINAALARLTPEQGMALQADPRAAMAAVATDLHAVRRLLE